MAARLQVDGVHVITGHTHRAGPNEDEAAWPLPGGGQLHNTGSWVFASAFHTPGRPAQRLLAGHRDLARGRGAAAPRPAADRAHRHGELSEPESKGRHSRRLSPATRR